MPGAVIVADQPSGAGSGVPGTARKDLWLSQQINLSVATSGNNTYEWALLDIPPGSAVELSSTTDMAVDFTPDVAGTYRVRLVTNGGGAGNIQILVLRVRFSNTGALVNRGWALPALGESGTSENNYAGNTRGYDEVFEFILNDLEPWANGLTVAWNGTEIGQERTLNVVGGKSPADDSADGRVNLFIEHYVELPFLVGVGSTASASPGQVLGARGIDISKLPGGTKTAYFVATIVSSMSADVAHVELWDVTTGVIVTNASLTNTAASDKTISQTFVSAALTIGVASGNIRSDLVHEYELRCYHTAGSLTDAVTCTNAHLRILFS